MTGTLQKRRMEPLATKLRLQQRRANIRGRPFGARGSEKRPTGSIRTKRLRFSRSALF